MHEVLKHIPISGIIAPGETYIFSAEKEYGWDPGPVDHMYVITRDEEILPALDMELCLILRDCYELRKFIRWAEVLEGCYEFRFRCFDKAANKEIGYSLFLQRLATFADKLSWARSLLIDNV
jgi:hypothetical protein